MFGLDLQSLMIVIYVCVLLGMGMFINWLLGRLKNHRLMEELCLVEDVEVVSDAPQPYRTGKFKLVPHDPKEYVLYAEYEKWTGDVHEAYAERRYQPANADDVRAYYLDMADAIG